MIFLFVATLGPVQPFIASSRRTRDLFAGSMLLSELSKAAAYAIAKQEEKGIKSLIFPAPLHQEDLQPNKRFNVANKIVAIVEQRPEQVGTAVRQAIQDRLEEIQKEAFGPLKFFDVEAANAQISSLVEHTWVAAPLPNIENYEDVREYTEAVLNARKHTLFFHAVTWGSHQEKSSIDGRLESVIPPAQYLQFSDTPQRRTDKITNLYEIYKAGPHERLSAVDLLKRIGLKSMLPRVLSTSHIAATPFLERLRTMSQQDQCAAKHLWDNYIQAVEKLAPLSSMVENISQKLPSPHPVTGDIDGALLFEERLLEDVVYIDKFAAAKGALATFFRFTDARLAGQRPSPYYVVLLADGDGMGKAIEAQAKRGPDGHRQISQALALFAGQVSGIVEEHKGALVYAGGDDVLALLPLHTALACARKLAKDFKKKLSDFKNTDGDTPTLSVGMAVVHHVSLLQDALTLVRSVERQAKDQPQKNSLAIVIQKRGGEPARAVISWPSIEMFETLIELCKARIIPGGMAYELRDMVQRLQTVPHDSEFAVLRQIIQIEAARIVRRKLYFSQHHTTSQSLDQLKQQLSQFLRGHLPQKEGEAQQTSTTLQEQSLAFMLSCIGIEQGDTKGFVVSAPREISTFVDTLIAAQVFAETLTRSATEGAAE